MASAWPGSCLSPRRQPFRFHRPRHPLVGGPFGFGHALWVRGGGLGFQLAECAVEAGHRAADHRGGGVAHSQSVQVQGMVSWKAPEFSIWTIFSSLAASAISLSAAKVGRSLRKVTP